MRGKWVLFSVAVVLMAIAGGAVSLLRRQSAEKREPTRPEAAAPPALVREVSLPGKILAQHVVAVGERLSGNIDSFLVDVGQDVFEGQLLARVTNQGLETARETAAAAVQSAQERVNKIDSEMIQYRLEASRARADAIRSRGEYERAQRAYQRQQMLHNAGATPRLTYERSERDFNKAQSEYDSLDTLARQSESRINDLTAELQNAQKLLEDKRRQLEEIETGMQGMEVHSPVAGVVVNRRGEVGKAHEEGTPIFEIAADLSLLEVILEPEPPVLARIKPGQPAMVIVADLQGQGIPATVKDISNNLVHVTFSSPSPVLRPGMTAQVRIQLD